MPRGRKAAAKPAPAAPAATGNGSGPEPGHGSGYRRLGARSASRQALAWSQGPTSLSPHQRALLTLTSRLP